MGTFSTSLAICAGNSPHKDQWRGALMFSFICVWINGWVNNRKAGDLKRYRAHYGITVMVIQLLRHWTSLKLFNSISRKLMYQKTRRSAYVMVTSSAYNTPIPMVRVWFPTRNPVGQVLLVSIRISWVGSSTRRWETVACLLEEKRRCPSTLSNVCLLWNQSYLSVCTSSYVYSFWGSLWYPGIGVTNSIQY